MTSVAEAFVVLEPSNHMGRVVSAAKRRGLHVVAFHHYPLSTQPPYGEDFARIDDRHRVESWDDHDALLARIEEACAGRRIAGTYAGLEFTLELEAKLRRRVGLPHNPPETVRSILDKHHVRRVLAASGLTGIRFWDRSEVDGWASWPEGLAAYFKPANGGGSCLVRRCTSLDDLRAAWEMWESKDEIADYAPFKAYVEKHDRYLLEEEIRGKLMSLEGYTVDGEYHPIGLTGRRVLKRDQAIEMACYFPVQLPSYERVVERISAIHRVLGVRHGPTHAEFMLLEDGGAELVELNLRFVGGDMLICMNLVFDTLVEDRLLDLACGLPVDGEALARAQRVAQLQAIMPPLDVDTFESLEFDRDVPFSRVIRRPGDQIKSHLNQVDYLALFIVTGSDLEECATECQSTLSGLRVNGRDVFRDDNNVSI